MTSSDPQKDLAHIEQVATMWRCRASISVESVCRELYAQTDTTNNTDSGDRSETSRHSILQLFFKEVNFKYYMLKIWFILTYLT